MIVITGWDKNEVFRRIENTIKSIQTVTCTTCFSLASIKKVIFLENVFHKFRPTDHRITKMYVMPCFNGAPSSRTTKQSYYSMRKCGEKQSFRVNHRNATQNVVAQDRLICMLVLFANF